MTPYETKLICTLSWLMNSAAMLMSFSQVHWGSKALSEVGFAFHVCDVALNL